MVALGQRLRRKMDRAGQREWVLRKLPRMAQVHDVNRLADVEPALQLLRLQPRGHQLPENHAPTDHTHHEEAKNAENQQCPGEAAHQIEQIGVTFEQVAEKAARRQQSAHPERGSNAVQQKKAAKAHSILPRHRRGQRGQSRHEFGDHQRSVATAAKRVLCAANAGRRLQ